MSKSLSEIWRSGLAGTFLAGLLFVLPVMLTIAIIVWIAQWLRDALGPGTFFGNLLTQTGATLVGPERQAFAYILGILCTIGGIWLIGLFISSRARRRMEQTRDWFFARVPLFRSIYNPIQRVVSLMSDDSSKQFSGMAVVRCRFGGDNGVDILALLTGDENFVVDGEIRRLVYLPTSPVPMSGGLVLVREQNIERLPGMKVEDLMKIYLSLGALAGECMPAEFRSTAKKETPEAG